MKDFIKALVKNNFDQIVANAVLNCHTQGVHSILFTDKIRMFYATRDHKLHENGTIAYHPHHCNLDLYVVRGTLYNRRIEITERGDHRLMSRYKYSSQLLSGEAGFEKVGEDRVWTLPVQILHVDNPHIYMPAEEIHTVQVPKGEGCAWFVIEGHEDPDYSGYCWSEKDPVMEPNLYFKPTAGQVLNILQKLDLV